MGAKVLRRCQRRADTAAVHRGSLPLHSALLTCHQPPTSPQIYIHNFIIEIGGALRCANVGAIAAWCNSAEGDKQGRHYSKNVPTNATENLHLLLLLLQWWRRLVRGCRRRSRSLSRRPRRRHQGIKEAHLALKRVAVGVHCRLLAAAGAGVGLAAVPAGVDGVVGLQYPCVDRLRHGAHKGGGKGWGVGAREGMLGLVRGRVGSRRI